jgi:putative MATE family efflux protein
MVVSTATVIINIILAPFLIFGWGTGYAFGVAGAAVSSLIAIAVGVIWLSAYFLKKDAFLRFVVTDWKPRFDLWKKLLTIGLPAGFEFALTAVNLIIVYAITRPFGAAAQAGFGIGMRVLQSGFMPVVALGFSVAPVAGQNFGARHAQRVKDTFKNGALMAAVAMLFFGILCHLVPGTLVGIFSNDPAVIAVGTEYLRIVSWSFVGSGVIFVASSMFQAMGNTVPALVSSSARMVVFAVPAFILAGMNGFELRWIWYLSVGAVVFQLALSLFLLRIEYRKRLQFEPLPEPAVPATVP